MISRHHWIAAFIGQVLRRGHATDPDWVYDTADKLYLGMCELDPEFAADFAFRPMSAVDTSCSRRSTPIAARNRPRDIARGKPGGLHVFMNATGRRMVAVKSNRRVCVSTCHLLSKWGTPLERSAPLTDE